MRGDEGRRGEVWEVSQGVRPAVACVRVSFPPSVNSLEKRGLGGGSCVWSADLPSHIYASDLCSYADYWPILSGFALSWALLCSS